jgi:hypothetical protein
VTIAVITEPLRVENTVQVGSVDHRLALGVQWVDALSQLSAGRAWVSELETIGTRPCPQRFEIHPQCRHALRAAGRIAKLLTVAAADKAATPPATVDADPTNFVLRVYGRASSRVNGYATGNDPRQYVPRRLSLTPVQTDGFPTDTVDNIRTAWLWPGSAYPLAAHVTALRGRVRRGPLETTVAWSRVVVTRPGAGLPDFSNEAKLGFAHGDDRGEFLVVLGTPAVPGGAALPATIALHVWVFLPPADAFDADDPLASLPLEVAGTDAISDVLRGTEMPGTYVRKDSVDVPALALGTTFTMDDDDLLFV